MHETTGRHQNIFGTNGGYGLKHYNGSSKQTQKNSGKPYV